MPRLSNQRVLPRFAAAVEALYTSAATSTPDELARVSARTLAGLISCESTSYNHLTTSGNRARAALAIAHYPAPPPRELLPAFEANMDKHVSFQVVQERGIEEAVLLSDFISSREFRRTAFYQDYYRHRGMRYQLGFAFAASETSTITVALNRWHGDFSADDRAVLTLLRPHFRRAYEFALARWLSVEEGGGRAASQADAVRLPRSLPLTAAIDHRPRGAWVSVTSEGRLPECPALVRGWLESYYPTQRGATTPARRDHRSGELLPDNLRRWWQTRTSPRLDGLPWVGSTLAIENGAGRRLTVRVLRLPARPRTSSAGETPTEGLLHFEEAPAVDRAAALRALGLTPRQAEVLWWLAHGKTNGEIGAILGASTHTVHHHVESILVQLGVISRAEATLRALEALGWLRWPQG